MNLNSNHPGSSFPLTNSLSMQIGGEPILFGCEDKQLEDFFAP